MSEWDTAAPTGWDNTAADSNGWVDDTPADTGDNFTGIAPEHISKHDGAPDDDACRNCGQSGHFARECTEPRKMSGECFNCGQVGHNKADCPNEAIDRPFTGLCRVCGEEGHRGSECPKVECRTCGEQGHRSSTCTESICKKCGTKGHTVADCTEKYSPYPPGLRNDAKNADEAWKILSDADAAGDDVADFIEAFWVYAKFAPELTLVELEQCFREYNFTYYLVAKEALVTSDVHTNVDLQGNAGKKYNVSFQKSLKPRRAKMAEGWPKSPEENIARLADAGFALDRMVTICSNCRGEGHVKKNCPEASEVEKRKITCANCNNEGHYVRDCPEPRVDHAARGAADVECKHCNEMGHFARDCPSKPSQACRNCLQEGHKAAECPNERVMVCRNCNGQGHTSRECDQPVNMDNVTCRNCDQKGHFSKECPEPKNWSKVQCRLCSEFGHGAGRCPNPEGGAAASDAGQDYTTTAAPATEAEGDWMNAGTAADAGGDDDWMKTGGDAAGATATADDSWGGASAAVSAW